MFLQLAGTHLKRRLLLLPGCHPLDGLLDLPSHFIKFILKLRCFESCVFLLIGQLDNIALNHLYSVKLGLLETRLHRLVHLLNLRLQLLYLNKVRFLTFKSLFQIPLTAFHDILLDGEKFLGEELRCNELGGVGLERL